MRGQRKREEYGEWSTEEMIGAMGKKRRKLGRGMMTGGQNAEGKGLGKECEEKWSRIER